MNKTKKGFNALSPFYDILSQLLFGRALFTSQNYFLNEIKSANSILVFGGGTGKLLLELIKQGPSQHLYYLDISDKMIRKSKRLISKKHPEALNKITFKVGSFQDLPKSQFFDVVITSYVLDCFPEEKLHTVMKKLDSALLPEGKWLFTDFNVSQHSVLMKSFSKLVIKTLYFTFNVICSLGVNRLPDFKLPFLQFGYTLISEKTFIKGLLVSRCYVKS